MLTSRMTVGSNPTGGIRVRKGTRNEGKSALETHILYTEFQTTEKPDRRKRGTWLRRENDLA